jgi:hypothetical protein
MPLCTSRNAYSAELVNYVRLHRLSSTSNGSLATTLTHLHHLRFLQLKNRYLNTLESARPSSDSFGDIDNDGGYRGFRIVADSVVKAIWSYLVANHLIDSASVYIVRIHRHWLSMLRIGLLRKER